MQLGRKYLIAMRCLKTVGYVGAAVWLTGCASEKPTKLAADPVFPKPAKIEPMVEFWKKVYSKWDLNTVVIHDNRYLEMIYEEVQLPQAAVEGYTPESKALIKSRFTDVESRMFELDKKLATGAQLNAYEKDVVTRLKKIGGQQALVNIGERVRYQRGMSSRYKAGLEKSYAYLPYFKTIFKNAGLPEDLAYLPHVETSFVNHARSKVGAAGMWQFMPSTGREYLPMNKIVDGRLDPIIAAKGASEYLKAAHDHLNSWPLAITSYNHGVGGMAKAKSAHGYDFDQVIWEYDGSRFGFASRNFYTSFLAAREIANQPKQYFSHYTPAQPLGVEAIRLNSAASPTDVARYFNVAYSQLASINPSWLPNAESKAGLLPAGMQVWLPKNTLKSFKPTQDIRIEFSPDLSITDIKSR